MGIVIAICLQVLGSLLFAGGAILQSLAVKSEFSSSGPASENKLSFSQLLNQFTKPRWLLGLLCVFAGAALHIVALTLAPVAVVQPIGIMAVVWSVMLASRVHGHTIAAKLWLAVLITVLGVVGFTTLSALFTRGDKSGFHFTPVVAAFILACVICAFLTLLALKAPAWTKAMLSSMVGAIFYGLASGMMKLAMNLVQNHGFHILDWKVLVVIGLMITCYVLGVWMIQQGYASGPAEITVGTMTTVDPFVAVLFGLIVLGEGSGMRVLPIVGMSACFALAVWGVARLSMEHPDAVAERERRAAGAHPATG